MANTQIAIARDIGLAKYESEGFSGAPELFSGDTPLPVSSYTAPVAANTNLPGYSVVGFQDNVPGNPLVMANWMGSLLSGDGSGLPAGNALTVSAVGTAGNTIVIGTTTYTMRATVAAANDIKIGATTAATAQNIRDAINADDDAIAAGNVGPGTVPHPDVAAGTSTGSVVNVSANKTGTAGNAIATTAAAGVGTWGTATLAGGTAEGAGGIRPVGITTVDAIIAAGINTASVAIFTSGCFNPNALNWDDTFNTDDKKKHAFVNSPMGTIIILKPKYDALTAVL